MELEGLGTPPGSVPDELAEQAPGQFRWQHLIPVGDRVQRAEYRVEGCIRHDERRDACPDTARHILVERLEAHEDQTGLRRRGMQRDGERKAGASLPPQIQQHELRPGRPNLPKRVFSLSRGDKDMKSRLGADPRPDAIERQWIVVNEDHRDALPQREPSQNWRGPVEGESPAWQCGG